MKIFLVGMMGVGKSYWAQRLAAANNSQAYDLDNIVIESEGKSITEIFEAHGEDYFRESEAELLRLFAENENFILATGGGTPCFYENMQWMNAHGVTIWIDEDIDLVVQRLMPEKIQRPLLKSLSDKDLALFLNKKLEERIPYYQQAQYRLGPFLEDSHFDFLFA